MKNGRDLDFLDKQKLRLAVIELYHYKYQPKRDFKCSLFLAIEKANKIDTNLIGQVYPYQVIAFDLFTKYQGDDSDFFDQYL